MSVVHAMASQARLESYQCFWLRFFIMLLLIVNIIIKTCWDSAFIVLDFVPKFINGTGSYAEQNGYEAFNITHCSGLKIATLIRISLKHLLTHLLVSRMSTES